jgi:hypothetical protein
MRYDFKAVLGRGEKIELYKTVQQPVLLMGGAPQVVAREMIRFFKAPAD